MKYSLAVFIGLVASSLSFGSNPLVSQFSCNEGDVAFANALVARVTRFLDDGTTTQLVVSEAQHLKAQVELCQGAITTATFCDQDAKVLNTLNSIIAAQKSVLTEEEFLTKAKELLKRRTEYQATCPKIALDAYKPKL